MREPTEVAEIVNVGTDLTGLADRLNARHHPDRRFLLGICGAPGAGKSTLADRLASLVGDDAVVVPMDGFHIATTALPTPAHLDRRGAIDTFDASGFLTLMTRIRNDTEDVVYAPSFDRRIGEAIAGMIPVTRHHRVVITEGNYLLSPEPGWRELRALFDEIWYLELARETRLSRLAARHVQFGKSPEASWAIAVGSDEENAQQIESVRDHADLVVRLLS